MNAGTHGFCPHCKRFMRTKNDGTLRHHGGPVGSGIWSDYRSYACAGVGETPPEMLTGRTPDGLIVVGRFVQDDSVSQVVLRATDGREYVVGVGSVAVAS